MSRIVNFNNKTYLVDSYNVREELCNKCCLKSVCTENHTIECAKASLSNDEYFVKEFDDSQRKYHYETFDFANELTLWLDLHNVEVIGITAEECGYTLFYKDV